MSLFTDETYHVVDRSTLELFSECPAMGCYCLENHPVVGRAAVVGSEAHAAISRTISDYLAAETILSPRDFLEQLEANLRLSRPDVQPEVIECMRPLAWQVAKLIAGDTHPDNILKYDGGDGERSGQLAYTFEQQRVTIASEVDLLHATKAPEVIAEHDWKTGWKLIDEDAVFNSFQFQMHAFLVLNHYPEAQALRVTIWNTRRGKRNYPVEFKRSDLQAIQTRLTQAIEVYLKWHDKPHELADTWPTSEKCRICSAVQTCPASTKELSEIEGDEQGFLAAMVAVAAKLESMEKLAASYVDRTGRTLLGPGGVRFGRDKPKADRKAPAVLYSLKTEE